MSSSAVALRFNLVDLAANYLVVVSLACVVDAVFMTTGLPFVGLVLLTPPAGFLLLRYWRFAASNGVVLAAVGPLLAYLLFALLYGVSRGDDWLLMNQYLFSCILTAVIAAHVVRSADQSVLRLTRMARGALLFSTVSVILSPWLQPYLDPDDVLHRYAGLWGNPNEAAIMTVVFLNFVLYRPYRRLIPNALAIALAAAAVAVSFSRTGLVLFFLSLVLFLFRRRPLVAAIACLAAGPLSFGLLSVLLNIFQRSDLATLLTRQQAMRVAEVYLFFEGSFTRTQATSTYLGYRDILWTRAMAVISDHFPHGAGFGSFHHLEGGRVVQISPIGVDWMGVHNMYLTIAGEAGMVVLVLLAACYGRLLAKGLFRTADGLPFSIIFVILLYWSNTHAVMGMRYLMVVFAIAVGLLGRTRGKGFRTHGRAASGAPAAVERTGPAR